MIPIINWLKWRITHNKNNLIIVCGETGSGKTFRALAIAEKLKPDFDVNVYVVFKIRDFFTLLNSNKLRKGDVIIWEEGGVEASNRNWYTAQNKLINYLFQTMRHRNFTLIMTVPAKSFIDSGLQKLFHLYIECKFVDETMNACRCMVMRMQYSSRYDKIYYKYFRLTNPTTGRKFVAKNIWINSPSQSKIDVYEPMKQAYTDTLYSESAKELDKIEIKKNTEWGKSKDYTEQIMFAKTIVQQLYNKGKLNAERIKNKLDQAGHPISVGGARIVKEGLTEMGY